MKFTLDTQDTLFISGALLVTLGTAIKSPTTGLIVGGSFLLLAPLLNLVQGFIRGLKS